MTNFERAAGLIHDADAVLITAGAGIGVDSGLPDFRGDQGFWNAYPALGRAGMSFTDIASPTAFREDPRLAWGFYGHRLNLYRKTEPHEGFEILKRIGDSKPGGVFVYTSNVDGQFQKAGFRETQIVECHGSVHYLQCLHACVGDPKLGSVTWPATGFDPDVDESACRLRSALPVCPECGELARPNILMFGDPSWQSLRTDTQEKRFMAWLSHKDRIAVIELGAGKAIPSVRRIGEASRSPLVRINLRDADLPDHMGVNMKMGALEAMRGIGDALGIPILEA